MASFSSENALCSLINFVIRMGGLLFFLLIVSSESFFFLFFFFLYLFMVFGRFGLRMNRKIFYDSGGSFNCFLCFIHS